MPDCLREDLGCSSAGATSAISSAAHSRSWQPGHEVDRTAVLQAGPDKLIDLAVQAIGHPHHSPATKPSRVTDVPGSHAVRGDFLPRHGSQASAPSRSRSPPRDGASPARDQCRRAACSRNIDPQDR